MLPSCKYLTKNKLQSVIAKSLSMNKFNVKLKKSFVKRKKQSNSLTVALGSTDSPVSVLKSPVKGDCDKKEYKVIQLANKLTVCLISDLCNEDVNSLLSVESDAESETDSEASNSDSDVESPKVDVCDVADDCKTHHTNEVKQAAAALCVGVGSFSDPKEVPGLAHFLEHMVFMGSKKFPQENDFDSFIKKHGGSDNASTDSETTVFYFECFEKHLHRALDKFAQFFISPLMKRESMTREREAVESEFQMALPSDEYRKEQLLASFLNESCPINDFTWGNLITLRDNISDDKLYEYLHDFRKRHYSANRMTLAVQARLPMDMLESFVVDCFSNVPNNDLSPCDFTNCSSNVFDMDKFARMYYVKPVRDICQVELTWALASLLHKYKEKPQVYISGLLGHEGKGSLLSYLKKKVWVLSIYAGNSESGSEHNSLYSFFSICLILTKDGLAHLDEVIEAVFSYINMLRAVGPQERIFDELQTIEETSFRFAEEQTAVDLVEDLAENMQFFPPEDYLTGPDLFFQYDPNAINAVTDALVPERMNIMILSDNLPATVKFDKVEKWFGTSYTDTEIPKEWLVKWNAVQPFKQLHVPEPNQFLTSNFELLPEIGQIPKYPIKIYETSRVELWYRKDEKFKRPLAYYYYYLISPLCLQSCENTCMLQMFVVLLDMDLTEEGYPAQIAELSYAINPCEKGITIKVDGYNEKLPVLLELIAKYIKRVPAKLNFEVFTAIKEKMGKSYHNSFLKPSNLAKDLRFSIIQNNYWPLINKHKTIANITFEMLQEFTKQFAATLFVQGLVQGNVSDETAVKTTNKLVETLDFSPLPQNEFPEVLVMRLPEGEHCCRVESFNNNDNNSNITNYYQSGPLSVKESVIVEFIMLSIEEPLFDILRTKEQLGYYVSSTMRDTFGILGFSITVVTQADKYDTKYVDDRIESFIQHSQKLLRKLSGKKIKQMKRDLIKIKMCTDTDLETEVSRNWSEIVNMDYVFDRTEREIKAIEQLRIGDVKEWWESHNSFGSRDKFRKLSIQIVGHPKQEIDGRKGNMNQTDSYSTEDETTISHGNFSITFVGNPALSADENKPPNYFITDVDEFRKTLPVYPRDVNICEEN